MNFTNFVGVDVAKNKIDIFNLKTNEHMTIANRTKGIEKTFSKIEKEGTLVLLENTGGYEKNCIDVLIQLGFAIHRTENRNFKIIAQIKNKIKESIKKSKKISKKIEGMLSYKGVSLTTAIKIVVYLSEIGEIQTRKVVALSGLAPYVRESGTLKMYTTTSGYGRSKVKCALSMAALGAIRFKEKLSSFYKRLLANGKKKKVALVACMRKMIILLNAIVRDGFNKELTQNTGGVSC